MPSSNICLVLAPRFRPTLALAIHTDTLQERAESGWARFNKQEQLDTLRRSMTEVLSTRAEDPLHMEAVREQCRKSVAEFVRNWLLKEDHWRKDRLNSIIVVFPDEQGPLDNPDAIFADRIPTLTID